MLVSNNSYLILGLDSGATEKEINKRYKEILKLLSIDEVPEYDTDIPLIDYKKLRKEDIVKNAFSQITNHQKKIYQDFFRFDIVDKVDEQAFKYLCDGEIIKSLKTRENIFNEKRKTHHFKNYILLKLFFFENIQKLNDKFDFDGDEKDIADGFYKILHSEAYRKNFEKIYNLNNDIPLSKEVLRNFREELPQYIVEAFFDISEDIKKQSLYKTISKRLGLVAQELDDNKNVTKEIDLIKKTFEKIKKLKLDGDDLDEVIDGINKIEDAINRLKNLGLTDNSKLRKLRDNVANEILSMAISLNNNYSDEDNALNFLIEAKGIACSSTIISRINENEEIIKENINKRDELINNSSYNKKETSRDREHNGNSLTLTEAIPLDELNIPISEIKKLLNNGGKFVVYKYCYSVILFTKTEPSKIYFLPPGVTGFVAGLKYTLLSLIVGWWGIPRGPIYTIGSIITNCSGGENLTPAIRQRLGI